jgi:phosphohistidine phosphatase
MKTLYLIRHSKSSWEISNISDLYRPLNQRGYDDALALGAFMQAEKYIPEVIISSPSVRTYSTALIVLNQLSMSQLQLEIDISLYETDVEKYADAVLDRLSSVNTIALVGHNDIITHFAEYLTANALDAMKTSSILAIELNYSFPVKSLAGKGTLRARKDFK